MAEPNGAYVEALFPEAIATKARFGGKAVAFLSLLIGFVVGACFMNQMPVIRSTSEVELFAAPAAHQVSMPRVGSLALAQPRTSASLRIPGFFGSQIGARSLDPLVPQAKPGSKTRLSTPPWLKEADAISKEYIEKKPEMNYDMQDLLEREGYNGHKLMFDTKKVSTSQIAFRLWVEKYRGQLKEEFRNLPPKEAKKQDGTRFFLGNPWVSHKWKAMDREAKEPFMKFAAAMKAINGARSAEEYLGQYGYGNMTKAQLRVAGMRTRKWSVSKIEKVRARAALEESWKERKRAKGRQQAIR